MIGIYGAFDRGSSDNKNIFNQLTLGFEYWKNKLFIGSNIYMVVGKSIQSIKEVTRGEKKKTDEKKITAIFGSYEKFSADFKQAALTQFGSGWAWLVQDGNDLKITKTPNADLPMAHGQKALLTCDVWEHAYYLKYRNRKAEYIDNFWKILNWDYVQTRFNVVK